MVEIKQKTYNTDKGKERIILVTQEPNAIPVAWLALNEQCRSKEKKLLFFLSGPVMNVLKFCYLQIK